VVCKKEVENSDLIEGSLRYSELRKKMKGVTERVLILQLQKLEEGKLIDRKVYTSKLLLKTEYSLTEFGKTTSSTPKCYC